MQETAKTNKPYAYNGSSSIKKALSIIILLILSQFISSCSKQSIDTKAPIDLIFYQPLLKDKMDWNSNFKKLQQAEIETIILQWSKFGVVDFMKEKAWLNNILFHAQKYKIKVIVGLYGDNKYFKTLENKNTNVKKYLTKLHTMNILQAKKVFDIAKEYNSFFGYYIYDEIDDTNFIQKKRQKYLQTMADEIQKFSLHPLYISGYFSQHMSPTKYAKMFSQVTQKKYTILLQSGIGANLVNNKISSLYMQTFSKEFNGKFIPIVESFTFKNSKIKSIDLESLKQQINILETSSNTSHLSLFSLRYFLEQKLFLDYLKEYTQTKS